MHKATYSCLSSNASKLLNTMINKGVDKIQCPAYIDLKKQKKYKIVQLGEYLHDTYPPNK